jgi:tripartite ATP-independent transporter DctP family solute receptor
MKNGRLFVAAVFTVMMVFGAWNAASAETVLRLGSEFAAKSWSGQAAEKFAEYVKEKTKGEYSIQLFLGGQLGPAKATFGEMKMGSLAFVLGTNNTPCEWKEGKNFNATAAPFRYRTNEEMTKFFHSPLGKEMYDDFAKGGIRYIGYFGDRSARALTTTKTPVYKPADMAGLKIRVPGMKSIQAFFQEVGAKPTPLAFTDLFMGLKTGIVEGQDNGIDQTVGQGFYEVQKYYMELDHAFGTFMLYTSVDMWNKWPDSFKKVLLEGCAIAAEHNNKLKEEEMKTAYKLIQDKGMTFIPAKEIDRAAFEKIGERVFEKFDGDMWDKGFMQKVQKQMETIRKAG